MGMNVKSLRHHGSIITPPPPAVSPSPIATVLVRYFVDGVTPTDTLADGSQTFAFPDGPFQFFVLAPDGSNPPALDWQFNTDNLRLYDTLLADIVDLGGGLTTVSRLQLRYTARPAFATAGPSSYRDSTFEAQAFLHDLTYPFSQPYGPLLQFACDPSAHSPVFQTGTWYVNRHSRNGGLHIITSGGGVLDRTYPAGWDTSEKVGQGNLILLAFPSITWGTLSRLSWTITQLSGTTRSMKLYGFPYNDFLGNPTLPAAFGMSDPLARNPDLLMPPQCPVYPIYDEIVPLMGSPDFRFLNETEWTSCWMLDDVLISPPKSYQSFVLIERAEVSYNYAGTSYRVQAKLNGVDFGDPITLTCES